MSDMHTGSCLCGGVRYELHGEMRDVVVCHCLQCRKTSGHLVAATRVHQDRLVLKNEETLSWYASSDTAKRGFCNRCGSGLFWQQNDVPFVSIMAGTIDGATGLKIDRHIFKNFAGDYYDIADD